MSGLGGGGKAAAGLPKAKGAVCGSWTWDYFPVRAFLVSSVWSKASKSLQNKEIHLRSERVSLFYVRLLLLCLLVQGSFHLVFLI